MALANSVGSYVRLKLAQCSFRNISCLQLNQLPSLNMCGYHSGFSRSLMSGVDLNTRVCLGYLSWHLNIQRDIRFHAFKLISMTE